MCQALEQDSSSFPTAKTISMMDPFRVAYQTRVRAAREMIRKQQPSKIGIIFYAMMFITIK